MQQVNVIGGGLAGSEAAYYLAQMGIRVRLWEMRPQKTTAVHRTADLGELVCSNSLKSDQPNTAQGLLKREMRILGSLLLSCAEKARVPAGSALAVDRELFAGLVSQAILACPSIELCREEVNRVPAGELSIVASGPLTSEALAADLMRITGEENLFFYDAVAPSISAESLNMDKIFRASRYGKGSADYLNCPLDREEYENFYENLINADIKAGHSIDKSLFFNACMPAEVIARRGKDALRYGPMRPVGLEIPGSSKRAYAVLQLRQEDKAGTIYGMVGFQTRMRWGEQERIFRLIPGLEQAEFVRYGVMHRNTYINSPKLLWPSLQCKKRPEIFFAGQITGVEGYMESAATGIIAGINAARWLQGKALLTPHNATIIGALLDFISNSSSQDFQPMNANFGLLPPMEPPIKDKAKRYLAYVERALNKMGEFSESLLN